MLNLALLVLLFSVQNFSVLYAQDAHDCEQNLLAAEEKYFTGYFEESIQFIEDCLQQGELTEATKIKSCKLLSLNFLADNNAEKATLCVKKLLAMNPDYLPDEEKEPREFVELVYTVKLEIQKTNEALQTQLLTLQAAQDKPPNESVSGGNGKWLLLAAATGGIVSAIVVLAMRQNEDGGNGNGNGNPGRN